MQTRATLFPSDKNQTDMLSRERGVGEVVQISNGGGGGMAEPCSAKVEVGDQDRATRLTELL